MSEVTQVAYPWRATVRTGFQVGVALLTLIPVVLVTSGLSLTVVGGQVIAVTTAVAKVMALPQVNAFIDRFVPWLAAEPVPVMAKHRAV
ncbi:hypothetical protein [Rhodococcus sp. NPDC060176]|uniref:hypothetical protein n=1 Tax=Rhodococcus sp. NPDC060176 TaxID=3347062 RepID=UPI00366A3D3A